MTLAPSRADALISIPGASLAKVAATSGRPEMTPALRATTTARAAMSSGMVAIEVTSPARPRSSASARATAASISSGERKASGQSREVVMVIRRSGCELAPMSIRLDFCYFFKLTIRSTERRALSAIAGSITTSSFR